MDNLPDAIRKTTGKKQYADTVALQFFGLKIPSDLRIYFVSIFNVLKLKPKNY